LDLVLIQLILIFKLILPSWVTASVVAATAYPSWVVAFVVAAAAVMVPASGSARGMRHAHGAWMPGYGGSRSKTSWNLMRTSHLLIHPLHLQWNTYKDLSLELVPSNLTIRYFRFLELILTYMRM
jgi:hypothetical protein